MGRHLIAVTAFWNMFQMSFLESEKVLFLPSFSAFAKASADRIRQLAGISR
jgi:hypothetical protein